MEASHELPLRHILLPVDQGEASMKAFNHTLQDIYRKGDTIHLFHCIPPGQHVLFLNGLGMEDVTVDYDDEARAKMAAAARETLSKMFVPKLDELKIPYFIEVAPYATDADAVGNVICKRAAELGALVVIAKHDKGMVEEFFAGSSTNYCVKHCKTPVLVLHCD